MKFLGRVLRPLGRVVVCFGAAGLLVAWLVPIDPLDTPADAPLLELLASRIEALRFQLGLFLGATSVGLVLSRAWRFSLIGALLTACAIIPALAWPPVDRPARGNSPSLRVLSLNLGSSADEQLVVDQVIAANVDVLVLQEYTHDWQDRLPERLVEHLPFRHEHVRADSFGMAVFSRFAWARLDELELFASGTPQFRLEYRVDETSIVLYALHLLPPVTALYPMHRAECAAILRTIGQEGPLTLLVGDFNFVDHSATGRALHARGFQDAHGLAGTGRGATWPVNDWLRHVPGIRIDHLYLGRGLTSAASWVGGHTGSDHLPVGASVVLTDD